jgi:translation initiation factor IF-1
MMSTFIFFAFLNKMGKSKKGRLNGNQRKEINQRLVNSVLDTESDEIHFGRVVRHLGAGNIRIILSNKVEGIAKIRSVLSRRGSTPIVSGDIVVLSGRDFETSAVENKANMRYDVLAVMTRQEASRLEKAGRIPSWMMLEGENDESKEDIFDYTEIESEDEENLDIDKI